MVYLIVPHRIEVGLVQGILCPVNQLDGIGICTGDLVRRNPQERAVLGMKLPAYIVRNCSQFPGVCSKSPTAESFPCHPV